MIHDVDNCLEEMPIKMEPEIEDSVSELLQDEGLCREGEFGCF